MKVSFNKRIKWDWPWCINGSHDAERGVENLEVNFILHLSAPAGPRYRHYGDTNQVSRDVRVEGDDIAQMGLNHCTLKIRAERYSNITELVLRTFISHDGYDAD